MRKVAARARWVERLIRTGEWASRHVLPFLVVGVAAGLVHRSVIETDRWGLVASGLLGAVLVGAIVREVLASRGEKPGRGSRAVTELRILVPAAALMQITVVLARSASLELGALLYLFALVTVTFFSRTSSVPALVVVLLLEWVQTGGPGAAGGAELSRRLATTLFLTFFGAFGLAFLRTEIVRIRAKGKERLEESIRSMSERAREYRLTSAPSSGIAESDEEPRDEAEERQMEVLGVRSSLNEIHSTIYTLLEVVRRTMGLHTCILLWKDGSGEYMKIIEAATGSSSVVDMPIPAGHGLTGVVAGRGKPVRICPVAEGSSNVPYYSDPEPLRSICIVPVVEGSVVRGVLCADRLTEDAFDDSQVRILERIADQSMRIITNERVFLQLVKSKTEQMRLYRASTRLRDASGCDEVLEAAFESMRSIVS